MLLNNIGFKVLAPIMGYGFWYMLSYNQVISVWLTIPISFYNIPQHVTLDTVETVSINIAARRSHLYSLDTRYFFIHIDAQHFHPGTNYFTMTTNQVLLPRTITLLQYKPANICIHMKQERLASNDTYK